MRTTATATATTGVGTRSADHRPPLRSLRRRRRAHRRPRPEVLPRREWAWRRLAGILLRGRVEARVWDPVRGDVARDEARDRAGTARPAPGALGPGAGTRAGAVLAPAPVLVLVFVFVLAAVPPREREI